MRAGPQDRAHSRSGGDFPLPERHVAGNGGYRPECGRWAGHRATVLERLASLWQNGEMAVFVFPC